VSDTKSIDWFEIGLSKKEARGLSNCDLGEVQEVGQTYVVTQKGTIKIEIYSHDLRVIDLSSVKPGPLVTTYNSEVGQSNEPPNPTFIPKLDTCISYGGVISLSDAFHLTGTNA
jgi:hypothetical protein